PTVLDDLIDRSLAGALKQSALDDLTRVATSSEAAARRIADADSFTPLMEESLKLAAANAPSRLIGASPRVGGLSQPARSSVAKSRLLLQAATRRRKRIARQSIGALLTV